MVLYAELKGYPLVSQLDTKTLDAKPLANKYFNCVLCCVMSTIYYFHPEWRGKIDVNSMLDEVLGANHTGGSDAFDFVAYAAKHGVKLSSTGNLNPAQQIMASHRYIQQGIPVIFTQEDGYVNTNLPQYKNWTHATVWFKEIPNGLACADSLGDGTHIIGARVVEKSDSEWMSRLRGSVLWIAENKVVTSQPTQPTQVQPAIKIPQGWRDDGTTLIAPTGFRALHGFRDFILTHNWNSSNSLVSDEYQDTSGKTRQDCYSCALLYNPKNGVTLLEGDAFLQSLWEEVNHYSTLVAHDKPLIVSLQQQVTDEQGKTQNALAALSTLQGRFDALSQTTAQIQSQDTATITALQAQHEQDAKTIVDLKQSIAASGNVKSALSSVDAYIQQALKTFDEATSSAVPVASQVPTETVAAPSESQQA